MFVAFFLVSPPSAVASHSNPKPITTESWYQDSVSTSFLDSKGCNVADKVDSGTAPTQGLVIMSFGNPVKFSATSWGATAYNQPDVTTGQIREAMKAWAGGFNRCLGSVVRPYTDYIIAPGVTNQYPSAWTTTDIQNHAQQWANMVTNVHSFISSSGWTAVVTAAGAADIELGYDNATRSRAWSNGYSGAASRVYFNFGDAAGCQTFANQGPDACGTPTYPGWSSSDVYHVSWGSLYARSQPQIYNTGGTHAEQWVMISKWAIDNGNSLVAFDGPTTQEAACNQHPGTCSGTNNTPAQGWSQMNTKMDAKPQTIVYMRFSTDMRWQSP